ncbi:MAG TPA: hypothetical protein VLK35_02160 [Methylomirabilota bacterium]|nr:hypothetical protein [Methylomirabilota bacterium]
MSDQWFGFRDAAEHCNSIAPFRVFLAEERRRERVRRRWANPMSIYGLDPLQQLAVVEFNSKLRAIIREQLAALAAARAAFDDLRQRLDADRAWRLM